MSEMSSAGLAVSPKSQACLRVNAEAGTFRMPRLEKIMASNGSSTFTLDQVTRLRQIERIRVARGMPGFRDLLHGIIRQMEAETADVPPSAHEDENGEDKPNGRPSDYPSRTT